MTGIEIKNSMPIANWFTFVQMTKRNIKLFFKDKATVFFSMLSPLILLMLFVLYLGDMQVTSIQDTISGLGATVDVKSVKAFVNSWLISGVLGTSCITVALTSLNVMVSDKSLKVTHDFIASPVKSHVVMFSYFMGAFLTTFFLSVVIYAVGLCYLAITGGFCLSIADVFEVFAILFLGCLSSTFIMMPIVSFIKNLSQFSAFTTILCTLTGFLIGAYMPLSMFPEAMQYVSNVIPGTHAAALFRNILMSGALENLSISLPAEFSESLATSFVLELNLFGYTAKSYIMYIYLGSTTALFAVINLVIYKFKKY